MPDKTRLLSPQALMVCFRPPMWKAREQVSARPNMRCSSWKRLSKRSPLPYGWHGGKGPIRFSILHPRNCYHERSCLPWIFSHRTSQRRAFCLDVLWDA
jgi:hypothetical protein